MTTQNEHLRKKQEIPTPFQKKTCWTALTAVSILALFAVAIIGILATNYTLAFLEPVLLPVIIAAVLAYLLGPIVSWIERRKISRGGAVIIVMTGMILVIAAFFWVIVPPLIAQTNSLVENREKIWDKTTSLIDSTLGNPLVEQSIDSLYAKSTREFQTDISPLEQPTTKHTPVTSKEKLIAYLDHNSSILISKGFSWLTSGGKAIFGLIGMTVGLVMTPIFMFYFLKNSDPIKEHWHDILPLKASHFKQEVIDTLQEINGYLISFFRGQMLVSIIDGALIAILLKAIGLPYAFTIGAAVAILGIIPYLGTIITIIPALLIAWTGCPEWWPAAQWGYILLVLGIFIGVNQFDGWVIQPKIVGDSVGLHPLTVMFSVLFWTLVLGGLVGALLAVPLTAAIKVLFRRYIWQNINTGKELVSS